MDIALPIILFALGLYLIVKGGNYLVDTALKLRSTSGISSVTIGATVVAIATAIPEIFISVYAVSTGNHGIAVGNSVGTMIANFALVFAIYAVLSKPAPVTRTPSAILSSVIFLSASFASIFLFASDLQFSFLEGIGLLSIFVIFMLFSTRNKRVSPKAPPVLHTARKVPIKKIILGFSIAQAFLFLGAFLLVRNGETIATLTGSSQTVIGFTIIAIGNAFPELVTVIASIKRGSGGLAMGSLIGANIINSTLLLGICGVIGSATGDPLTMSAQTLWISLPVLFAVATVAILPVVFKGKTYRWQGLALLGMYIIYLTYLFVVQPM